MHALPNARLFQGTSNSVPTQGTRLIHGVRRDGTLDLSGYTFIPWCTKGWNSGSVRVHVYYSMAFYLMVDSSEFIHQMSGIGGLFLASTWKKCYQRSNKLYLLILIHFLDGVIRFIWQVCEKSAYIVDYCCNSKHNSSQVKWLLVAVVMINKEAKNYRPCKILVSQYVK